MDATTSSNHGQLLCKRYRLVRVLGQGGMGVVWLADDLWVPGRQVAVKLARLPRDQRFAFEACACAMSEHENVVALLDVGETEDGFGFLVLEYLRGRTLADLLIGGPLRLEDVVEVALQLGRALSHMHRRRILHRDIKPHNVMIVRDDAGGFRVKLLDFGVASAVGDPETFEAELVMGTPGYMPPEQRIASRLDGRVDQFALACTLRKLVRAWAESPRHIPRHMVQALDIAMAEDPAARFDTIEDFVHAFAGKGAPTPRRRPTTAPVVYEQHCSETLNLRPLRGTDELPTLEDLPTVAELAC